MKKEAVKKFLIKSIPSILLLFFRILNSENLFIMLPIMSAHPFYLVMMEMKTSKGNFFKGLLEICIFLLPYVTFISKYDELSIGKVIAIAEYGIAIFLWSIVFFIGFIKTKGETTDN